MTDTESLVLTDGEISDIYAELAELNVELDDDPLLYGPKRLNSKVAETRKMLTRCEKIFLECSRRLHGCHRETRKESALLDMAKQDLLANDPEVRAGRNIADRDAIAAIKLRPTIEVVQKLQVATTDLETVITVVKSKRMDIKDMQNRLKEQQRLCQDEIGLGGRWGSVSPSKPVDVTTGQSASPPRVGAVNQIESMFDQIDAELAAVNADFDQIEAEVASAPPAEIDELLDEEDASEEELVPEPVTQISPVASLQVEQVLTGTASQSDTDDALDAMPEEDDAAKFVDDEFGLLLG